MICVFDVIEGPARGKRFWLRENQRLCVGRISTADFAVPSDQHMSRHHFIVEATRCAFRLRDAGSSNGTFVNNSKVATMELCTGDRIRAGVTTLEVSLIAEQQSAPVQAANHAAQPDLPNDPFIPIRSLDDSSLNLGAQRNLMKSTRRFDEAGRTAEPLPAANRVTTARATWAGQFMESGIEHMYYQRVPFDSRDHELSEILRSLSTNHHIILVVNDSQLGRLQQKMLADWCDEGVALRISKTLLAVTSDHTEDFWNFIRSSTRQDGLIAFASRHPTAGDWLTEFISLLSYPSMLDGILRAPTSSWREELMEHCDLVFFEQDRSGRLGLLCQRFPSQNS